MATWSGYYINLDRSTGRRASMDQRLAALSLGRRYQRFPAVDGAALGPTEMLNAGARGCFRSHIDLIAAKGGREFIHIVEDDTVFSSEMEGIVSSSIDTNGFADSDLIYLNVLALVDVATTRKMKLAFEQARRAGRCGFIDLRIFQFSGTMSYLVNPASVPKLLRLAREVMTRGPSVPIYLFYRREIHAGRLRAKCFLPFLTTMDYTPSTINTSSTPGVGLQIELSRSFYIHADHSEALTRIRQLSKREPEDAHLELLGAIQRLQLSAHLGEL